MDGQHLGDSDRSVPAARAADGYVYVLLASAAVDRRYVIQQAFRLFQKEIQAFKTRKILLYLVVLAGKRAQFIDVVGVGKETDIEHVVRVLGYAVFEAKELSITEVLPEVIPMMSSSFVLNSFDLSPVVSITISAFFLSD